jgi:hypothetical protein
MRRALDGEALDAGRKRDGPGDARAGAFDGVGDFARRLVYDALVISLEPNTYALSIHTKNNCLLNLSENPAPLPGKADGQFTRHPCQCNIYFEVFWLNRVHLTLSPARGCQLATPTLSRARQLKNP